jgi:zinc protease
MRTEILAMLAVLVGVNLRLQEQEGNRLPTAAEVMDKYVEATGGRIAYSSLHNIRSKGTFVVVGTGIRGTLTTYEAEPDKSLSILEIPGGERVEEGTNGNVAWTMSSRSGARIKKDEERAAALREATFNARVHWRRLYPKADCAGTEFVNGRKCFKIVLQPASGPPITHYYDAESFFLTKSVILVEGTQGKVPSENYYSDYKEVNGVLFPYRLNHRVGREEIVVAIDTIECNVEMPRHRFNLPEEVRALLHKLQDKE